jgi:hypothetical protein
MFTGPPRLNSGGCSITELFKHSKDLRLFEQVSAPELAPRGRLRINFRSRFNQNRASKFPIIATHGVRPYRNDALLWLHFPG